MRFQPLTTLWRRGPPLTTAVLTGLALTAACSPSGGVPQQAPLEATSLLPPSTTVVSLIFSDTLKSQTRVGPLFARHGLHATLYVNSSRIGSHSAYLSLGDLQALAEAGHEVGSHTAGHKNLEELPLEEVRQQVCDDRVALMRMGFSVTSFAYPFSSDTPTVRQVIEECGFSSASATGLLHPPHGCAKCPQICDGCAEYGISEAKLAAFLEWLAPRSSRSTYVRTPYEVLGGPVSPPVPSDGGVVTEARKRQDTP